MQLSTMCFNLHHLNAPSPAPYNLRFLGAPLGDMLRSDVKPALMAAIEGEFAKCPKDPSIVPVRFSRADAGKRAAGGAAKGADKGELCNSTLEAFFNRPPRLLTICGGAGASSEIQMQTSCRPKLQTLLLARAEGGSSSGAGGGGGGGGFDADDLLPRSDISASITPAIITSMGSSNWKDRKQVCVRGNSE